MERYESKQERIERPAVVVYDVLSDFTHLTPVVADKVEEWQATEDTCSFKVKGFTVHLRMIEKESPKLIKIVGEDGSPMDFTFWMQLAEVSEADTRMRIVMDVELNMMMKMMIGGKLSDAVNQIASQIATAFNNMPV